MAGGTPRHHGLGVRRWRICLVSGGSRARGLPCLTPLRPHSGAVTTVVRADAPTRQRRRGRVPGADCACCKSERISAKIPGSQPTRHRPVNRETITRGRSDLLTQVDQLVRETLQPDADDPSPCCDHARNATDPTYMVTSSLLGARMIMDSQVSSRSSAPTRT